MASRPSVLHRLRLRSEPTPESDDNDGLDTESTFHRTEPQSADSGRDTSIASSRFKASVPYRSGSLISTTSTLNAGVLGRPIVHSHRSRDDLGLHLVTDRLEPSGDIVFVHGLGGHPWTTWSWERDLNNFWPSWLEHEGALSTWRVFTFGYDSNWRGAGANLNISDFAKDLLLQILTFTSSNGSAIRPKKIIFIAHSMGGLVVKKAYLLGKQDSQFADIAASFHGIIFLATPHRGAQSASTLNNILASLPLGPPSKGYVAELQLHSSALLEINESFRLQCQDFALVSFYETKKTSIGGVGSMIVERSSAILGLPGEVVTPLHANHRNMSKFKSPTDTQYVMMKNTISALVRKATSNEEETVDTKIENNHLRSEETNFDGHTRQTPMTGDITATASSAVSRDIWSSSYGRDTIGISTVPTSIDPGGDQEVGGVSPTDDASIYTSNIPEASAYAQELATSFFGISEPLPDLKYLERIHEVLPNLLRGFALKIGAESQSPEHFEIMKFIHGIRGLITSRFEEYYLDDHTNLENQQRRTLDGMVLDEKLERWQVDPMADVPDILPDMQQYFDDEGDDVDLEGANSGVYDLRLAMYRNAITTSTAFQWLVRRVDRETSLTTSEANKMHAIASQIRQALYAQRQNRVISSLNGPPKCSMVFKSNWNPLAFVSQQEYAEEPDDAIEGAIVIVQGVNGDTETMSCAEYLGRTWPLLGENLMALVRHVVMGEPGLRYSIKLFDSTMITAWFEPSGCFSVEASGVVETIVEVGEVYGWMTAALRSSPTDRITAITPILEISAETNGKSFRADFIQEHSDIFLCSTGQCWQNLFWNPVVVTGFPVRRRESGQEPGLECSLGMLTALLRSRNLAAFGNTVFVKGFCTMLVPTKYSNGTVHWHVLFNEDGSRISYTDPRVREVVGDFDLMKHLTLSGISSARHIVGWCELARNNAGTKEANYLIDRTRLEGPGSQFAFDRITFSGGKFVPVAVSAAIGKKDKPVRVQKTSEYYKQLEWAERRFVVFYEPEDRRAWLVDGLSALLHLVRAHVAHRRAKGREVIFGDKEIKEANPAHTGKTAADTFLRNKGNMDLRIYERWNRPVIETSTEGSDEPKSTVKRHQTFEHLVDLVGDIFGILSAAFDLQEDALRADGFGARVRTSTRRHLVGWDFMEVATLEESLWPKSVALLDTGIGWVDLARSIQAVTLFGVGFGEIVQPTATAQPGGESSAKGRVGEGQDGVAVPAATRPLSHRSEGEFSADAIDPVSGRNNDLQAASAIEGSDAGSNALVGYICTRWPILPKGKDLLATTTAVIKDIRESAYKGSPAANNRFWLTRNLYWHVPDKIFEKCHCGKAKPCDRVQVLLPTNFPNIFARALRSPDEPFPLHGAMIFGHSWKFPLRWPSNAESIPEEELAEQPQLLLESSQGLHMATPSDSGLGTSVSSSARGNASSQVGDHSDGRRSFRKLLSHTWLRLSAARRN